MPQPSENRPFDDPLLDTLFWAGMDAIFNPKENENDKPITSAGDAGMDLPQPEPNEKVKP